MPLATAPDGAIQVRREPRPRVADARIRAPTRARPAVPRVALLPRAAAARDPLATPTESKVIKGRATVPMVTKKVAFTQPKMKRPAALATQVTPAKRPERITAPVESVVRVLSTTRLRARPRPFGPWLMRKTPSPPSIPRAAIKVVIPVPTEPANEPTAPSPRGIPGDTHGATVPRPGAPTAPRGRPRVAITAQTCGPRRDGRGGVPGAPVPLLLQRAPPRVKRPSAAITRVATRGLTPRPSLAALTDPIGKGLAGVGARHGRTVYVARPSITCEPPLVTVRAGPTEPTAAFWPEGPGRRAPPITAPRVGDGVGVPPRKRPPARAPPTPPLPAFPLPAAPLTPQTRQAWVTRQAWQAGLASEAWVTG